MKRSRKLFLLLVIGIVALLGLLLINEGKPPPPPTQPLPNPNGYDDIVKAGQVLTVNAYDYLSQEALRPFVTKYAESLQLVRTGLSRECRVPIEYSQSYMGGHLYELASIKRLAQALNADGRLAEIEQRNGDAVRAYLETMQLGHEATRGGVLIDGLIRIACEAIGSRSLQNVVTKLGTEECREVITSLEAIESKEEPFSQVMKNERDFVRRVYPWHQRIVGSIQRLFNFGSIQQSEQKAFQKFQTQEKRRRELMLDVAARAYELEKGERPKNLFALVPGYLKAIPQDPFTGTNIVYQP